jgi:hypothetical protein
MNLKAHANQQPTAIFFRGKRRRTGRELLAVPRLRRVFRGPMYFLANAILSPDNGDVNLNLQGVSFDNSSETEVSSIGSTAKFPPLGGRFAPEPASWGELRTTAALDDDDEDEDEEDGLDDDDLGEDDDEEEDLEDEDEDDDYDEDEDDEDGLEDDDLDDEDDDEDEE